MAGQGEELTKEKVMGMWDGFDSEAWNMRPKNYRTWWQRLHIYLTGKDPWDKDDDDPPSGGGGGGHSATTSLAIRTALGGGVAGGV